MAQQLGSNYYNSPYKFNGKELDEETGLYYYGARYYSPRESIWLSADPLAEKYPNVSPYVYCLNNPTVLIDPDGMAPEPPKLNGIKNIQNVLAGRNWVDYRSKITRTSSLFGYELSRTSERGQCADYSRLQVEQGEGNHTAVGSKNRIDMYVEKGGDKAKFDLQKGINTIIENLGEGKSVMAGVMYDSHETGNPNGATNHYVTIVGMGTDKEGAYFSYYDNYTNGKGEKVGTDINKNKFRLRQDSKGNYYFADTDNNIPLNGNQTKPLNNKEDRPARYILTEVRDNE